jgi:arylsulfatase A-like enzyme
MSRSRMTRRQFGKTLLAGSVCMNIPSVVQGKKSSPSTERPNVLVIQPDQHRGTILRCAGDEHITTPNLDRLAQEGTHFSNCISSSPLCSPFRGTLQTGLYAHKHGVDKNNLLLDPTLNTFAEYFVEKGYATGYIGKWHLDGGIPKTQPGGYVEAGERRQGWEEWHGYEKNHEYFYVWKYDENQRKIRLQDYNWEPTWHTDMALDFISRNTNKKKPWLYYVAYGPPHLPLQCPDDFLAMYDPDTFKLPPDLVGRFSAQDEKKLRRIYQVYYGQVTAIDFEIGRILQGLNDLGVDRNTIILYTSDHGDKLGSHCSPRKFRGKAAPFASAFRIPLIIRWPDQIRPKQVRDCLVSSVDLAPTILDLAGLPVPSVMQGDSMAGWCLDDKGTMNESLYLGLGGVSSSDGWRAVWDGRYIYSPGKFNILYDHQTDPHETRNLIHSNAHTNIVKRMRLLLLAMAEKTGDPMYPVLKG